MAAAFTLASCKSRLSSRRGRRIEISGSMTAVGMLFRIPDRAMR